MWLIGLTTCGLILKTAFGSTQEFSCNLTDTSGGSAGTAQVTYGTDKAVTLTNATLTTEPSANVFAAIYTEGDCKSDLAFGKLMNSTFAGGTSGWTKSKTITKQTLISSLDDFTTLKDRTLAIFIADSANVKDADTAKTKDLKKDKIHACCVKMAPPAATQSGSSRTSLGGSAALAISLTLPILAIRSL